MKLLSVRSSLFLGYFFPGGIKYCVFSRDKTAVLTKATRSPDGVAGEDYGNTEFSAKQT